MVYDGTMSKNSPHASAAPPVSAGRRTVALALNPDIAPLLRGIYDVAARTGWTIVNLRYYGMKVPQGCRPDGVLFRLLASDEWQAVRRFLRLGVPVVQIDDVLAPRKCCCVVEDRRAIGRAAAEHFAQRGFRNMAYLHSEIYPDVRLNPLCGGFIERARALGAQTHMIAVQRRGRVIPWDRTQALAAVFRKEISGLPLPLGIFTFHDGMAVRICEYCQAVGLSVPEQVAVLGWGNDGYQCDFAATPLSSVDPNFEAQGRAGAELLDKLMAGGAVPKTPVLIAPAGIVTRKSTDMLALPDLDTARALRYMWEHLAEPLGVGDVADAVAISRRKLERHFRQHLGRSVNEELNRKRVEWSCELLTATKLPSREIGRQVGFNSGAYFHVVFRNLMGTTPKKYRQARIARSGEGRAGARHENPRAQ